MSLGAFRKAYMPTVRNLSATIGPGAPINKYNIDIEIPLMVKALTAGSAIESWVNSPEGAYDGYSQYKVLAHKVSLPATNMATASAWVRGHEFKLRGAMKYSGPVSVTCYLDRHHGFKKIMDMWMKCIDAIDNPVVGSFIPTALGGNIGSALSAFGSLLNLNQGDLNIGYMGNMYISQVLDKKETATYKVIHCYPVNVSEIEFDGEQTNKLLSVKVDFEFAYIVNESYY